MVTHVERLAILIIVVTGALNGICEILSVRGPSEVVHHRVGLILA